MTASEPVAHGVSESVDYVLRVADSSLILGQRLAEWCGHAPVLEEDIALANIALDHIGQARALLTLAGQMEVAARDDGAAPTPRDEDAFAYHRLEHAFRNITLVEVPNGDFARTLLRVFLWASFAKRLWTGLAASSDATLAGIAAKSIKECRYHQRHAGDWVVRLGDGSDESTRRMRQALAELWPYTAELFDADAVDAHAAASNLGPDWSTLREAWLGELQPVLADARLTLPSATPFRSTGKRGRHSEHLGPLLAEMQSVARAFPGAVW